MLDKSINVYYNVSVKIKKHSNKKEETTMTKKQEQLFDSYYRARRSGEKTELYQVYGRYSKAKQEALNYCKQLQARFNGYHGTIVSANSFIFTYAFLYWDADRKVECLCFITPSNDYKFALD